MVSGRISFQSCPLTRLVLGLTKASAGNSQGEYVQADREHTTRSLNSVEVLYESSRVCCSHITPEQ